MGIGKFFFKLVKVENYAFALDALAGAAFYAFLISISGHFLSLFETSWAIIISGFVIFNYGVYKKWFRFSCELPWQVWMYLFFGLLIAFYPSAYIDPLNYHLYGIIEWSKLDKLVHLKSFPQLMHNSFADYLYFPFSFLWGNKTVNGLLSLQVTSQLFTVVFGVGFFSFLMFELLKNKIEKTWMPLLILSVLTRASLQHKGLIAKIDWIAMSWFIASIYVFFKFNNTKGRHKYIATFFLSLSVGSKFSYAVPAMLLFLYFFSFEKEFKKKDILFFLAVFFLFLLPYFCRNFIWTGNPFFPMARKFFPSSLLGPSWEEGFGFYDVGVNQLSLNFFLKKMGRFFTYEPIAYFSLVIPLYFSKISNLIKTSWYVVYAFLVAFIFFFGEASEMRHFGPLAVLINVLGVMGLILIISNNPWLNKRKHFLSTTFLLIIIFNIFKLENQLNPIPSSIRAGIWLPRHQSLIDEQRGLSSLDFLTKNLRYNQRIAIIDDTPLYYLSFFKIVRLWDDPEVDFKLKRCSDLGCVTNVLKEENIQYLLESNFLFDPYYNAKVLNLILRAVAKYPQVIVQDQNGERLISVQRLSDVF